MHETRSDSSFSPYQSGTRRVRIPSGLPGVALTAARQACALLGVDTVTEPGGQPRERHGQQEVTTMGHLHPKVALLVAAVIALVASAAIGVRLISGPSSPTVVIVSLTDSGTDG